MLFLYPEDILVLESESLVEAESSLISDTVYFICGKIVAYVYDRRMEWESHSHLFANF